MVVFEESWMSAHKARMIVQKTLYAMIHQIHFCVSVDWDLLNNRMGIAEVQIAK